MMDRVLTVLNCSLVKNWWWGLKPCEDSSKPLLVDDYMKLGTIAIHYLNYTELILPTWPGSKKRRRCGFWTLLMWSSESGHIAPSRNQQKNCGMLPKYNNTNGTSTGNCQEKTRTIGLVVAMQSDAVCLSSQILEWFVSSLVIIVISRCDPLVGHPVYWLLQEPTFWRISPPKRNTLERVVRKQQ